MIVRESILLKEELVHTYMGRWKGSDIEIYKNPKYIGKFESWCRAISDKEGNIWVSDMSDTSHNEIMIELFKIKEISIPNYTNFSDDPPEKMEYCGWQRSRDTNNFYISESFYDEEILEYESFFAEFGYLANQKNPRYNFIIEKINNGGIY